jgi:hypothetical protein
MKATACMCCSTHPLHPHFNRDYLYGLSISCAAVMAQLMHYYTFNIGRL